MNKLAKTIKTNWILISILVLAAFLRLWQLGTNPPSLTPDEAALGYNAYSILKTARDEYGEFLPIVFKSFGDFKPGLYIYASVPFVAIFGLNEVSVRLVSALAGVAAVWLVYEIVGRLGKLGDLGRFGKNNLLPVMSALLLAISPWSIIFSRGAWEVNLALAFALAGLYFFLKSLGKNKFLIPSALFFGLSLVTYQGAKISVLIILVLLAVVYWRDLVKFDRKSLIYSFVVGFVISIPILLSFTSGQTGRLKVFSVFSYKRPSEYLVELLDIGKVEFGTPKYYLFYSEAENTLRGISGRWFNHFSPRFLIFEGDWQNPRHSSPDHGVLLLVDIVFFVLGIAALVKIWKTPGAKFILLWLVLAPLPSALSRDQVHAVRALNMVIPTAITIAAGLVATLLWLKKYGRLKYLVYLAILGLYIGSFAYFLDSYFVHNPTHNSQYWEYGYKQVVHTVTPIRDEYETVHVRQSFAQPYIYFLFYGGEGSTAERNVPYDPARYQAQANLIESEYGDVGRVGKLDNIRFLPIDWSVNRGDFGTLFVADPIRIPPEDSDDKGEFKVIDEIMFLDGKEVSMRIIEVLDEENVNK